MAAVILTVLQIKMLALYYMASEPEPVNQNQNQSTRTRTSQPEPEPVEIFVLNFFSLLILATMILTVFCCEWIYLEKVASCKCDVEM